MQIQSLSVCVPAKCPNKCPFCVSRMHTEEYDNHIERGLAQYETYKQDFLRRLEFARDNGCNTVILTGVGEPLVNKGFLKDFATFNQGIQSPFRWIELQTSGIFLDEEMLGFLRSTVGVSTISLSVSYLHDSEINAEINNTPEKLVVDISNVCGNIIKHGFNLRLSLNMTDEYEHWPIANGQEVTKYTIVKDIFDEANSLGANQVTFRQLYVSGDGTLAQNKWVAEHSASKELMDEIKKFIQTNGKALETLPFGAVRYSVCGMSVVLDDDCMGTVVKDAIKFLILRPNCKLYTKWDDKGSLLF